MGDEAAQWLDRWSIEVRTKEPGAHATIVERHHDVLRRMLLRVEDQLKQEGVSVMPFEMILGETVLAKNLLTSVAGVSPYQAVYGRLPPIMLEFEPLSETQLDDMGAGIPGVSKGHHRLRELAVAAMVDATARQRIERAMKARTRRTTDSLQLKKDDLVEFHRPPLSKDDSGWRGPASVVDVEGGTVTIKWQGRFMQNRVQDVRRALVLLAMLTNHDGDWANASPTQTLTSFTDHLNKRVLRLGWIQANGWLRVEGNRQHGVILLALLHVAACGLHLKGCIGGRLGQGVSVLEGVAEMDESLLWWWVTGRPKTSWYLRSAATGRLSLTEIFGDDWPRVSFVQFLLTTDDQVQRIRQGEPEVANIGGPFDPEFPMPQRKDPDEAMSTTSSKSSVEGPRTPRGPDASDAKMRQPVSPASSARTRTPKRGDGVPTTPTKDDNMTPYPSATSTPRTRTPRRNPKTPRQQNDKHDNDNNDRQRQHKRDHASPDDNDEERPRQQSRTTPPAVLPIASASGPAGADDDDDDVADQDSQATTVDYGDIDLFVKELSSWNAEAWKTEFGYLSCAAERLENLGATEALDSVLPNPDVWHDDNVSDETHDTHDDFVELALPSSLCAFPSVSNAPDHGQGHITVLRFMTSGETQVLIEREMNVLTLQEAKANQSSCKQAMTDELKRWHGLKAFERQERRAATNVLDSRLVLK
jgi:hypothetical protein